MQTGSDKGDKEKGIETSDAQQLLQERHRLEKIYREKYTREITVMFTDLKGSTALTDLEGDFAVRELLNNHNDMLFPLIEFNEGKLVKTMGDGTMSYFESAQNALRCAVSFQQAIADHNSNSNPKIPIEVRTGLNTGLGIVEESDIFGDVVNVASRYETLAGSAEIFISPTTFEAMSDHSEFYVHQIKSEHIKGKKEEVEVYKAFWNDKEIIADKKDMQSNALTKKSNAKDDNPLRSYLRIVVAIGGMLAIVFALMTLSKVLSIDGLIEDTRTIQHSVSEESDSEGGDK